MEVRTSSIAFFKANLREGHGIGEGKYTDLGTLDGTRILLGRLITGVVVVEATLYGSLDKKSRGKVSEGNRWSPSLVAIVELKVTNIMSATEFVRSDTNVNLPEESRNPMQ